MNKGVTQLSGLQLAIVMYGIKKYPISFRRQCENEIKRRSKVKINKNQV